MGFRAISACVAAQAKATAAVSQPSSCARILPSSFSEEELTQKGTGLLATMFSPTWWILSVPPEHVVGSRAGCLADTMRSCPMILIVTYDTRTPAPASEGDVLGLSASAA